MKTTPMVCVALLGFAPTIAAADILWTEAFRFYGIGVTQGGSTVQGFDELGTLDIADSVFATNSFGTNTSQIAHQSTIIGDTYSSSITFNLQSIPFAPGTPGMGGFFLSSASFTLTETTTLDFIYTIDDQSNLSDSSFLTIGNPEFGTVYESLLAESGDFSFDQTFAPGDYNMMFNSSMEDVEANIFGDWTFSTNLAITTTPAPGTALLLLIPATTAVIRRNRKSPSPP